MNSHIPGGLRPGKKIVINAIVADTAKESFKFIQKIKIHFKLKFVLK